jgi:hypothetical protein
MLFAIVFYILKNNGLLEPRFGLQLFLVVGKCLIS